MIENDDVTPEMVAKAICAVCSRAGQDHSKRYKQAAHVRAANLLKPIGPYGPYIEAGDPKGWSRPEEEHLVACTIYMEAKGGEGDCMQPLAYYEDGLEVSMEASELLPRGAFIEFMNPAVALVWQS